jgi:hypothetical protein
MVVDVRQGDDVQRVTKIDSWPQAVVAVSGLVATGAIVVALVWAGWSGEAIIGFAALAAGLFTGQYVNTRRASAVEAKTDQQTQTLATIVRQTNGLSHEEREKLADEAADRAAVRVIAAYRNGELR